MDSNVKNNQLLHGAPCGACSPISRHEHNPGHSDKEESCWRATQVPSSLARLWKGALLWPPGVKNVTRRGGRAGLTGNNVLSS